MQEDYGSADLYDGHQQQEQQVEGEQDEPQTEEQARIAKVMEWARIKSGWATKPPDAKAFRRFATISQGFPGTADTNPRKQDEFYDHGFDNEKRKRDVKKAFGRAEKWARYR
eukprot:gnl/MRDRNA2_/MRDRNA2_66778_c0_seq3.p1 gnl/MRDRNA2_/MRDRNA2_66778_c0~~gnl/MRDRNA2_/MRDRNA2_66778_c0_seq3.p1  ORF type:complete len:112 (+),score=21.57 gnl/MRDRNA2_/MRDRNA2_66778_c0_seq3:72-407(+)